MNSVSNLMADRLDCKADHRRSQVLQVVEGVDRIHLENARKSGWHGAQQLAQCVGQHVDLDVQGVVLFFLFRIWGLTVGVQDFRAMHRVGRCEKQGHWVSSVDVSQRANLALISHNASIDTFQKVNSITKSSTCCLLSLIEISSWRCCGGVDFLKRIKRCFVSDMHILEALWEVACLQADSYPCSHQ